MNDVALWVPALLLPLFCLIYSVTDRQKLYFPLPKSLSAGLRNQNTVYLAILCALILTAAVSIAEALMGAEGLGLPDVALRLLLLCLFALYLWDTPRAYRKSAVFLAAVAAAGPLVRAIWSTPVDLLFIAVSAFGCMVMLEREGSASGQGMSDRSRTVAMTAITLTFLMVMAINAALILNLTRTQCEEIGRGELEIIRGELQDTLSNAEGDLLHVALMADTLISERASLQEIEHFILDRRDSLLASESFMNIYIAGRDWIFVPGFEPPPDFHATERVWYIGAAEHPGQAYISEPYLDITTGNMCFTISTMLSDGETVVGLDMNFSKVQQSIREMTADEDETALIVTDTGLIVGYSDMSLVGELAGEKLPEYAAVLARVGASQVHDSFQVRLEGRSRTIFSSETSNRWYLILSVSTEALYAESHRQIAALASVNLLMLVVLVMFYRISTRNRIQARLVLERNRSYIDGFSEKLRLLTIRVLRLGDPRLLREDETPEALARHVREAGEELSQLADDIRAYSDTLLFRQEEWQKKTRSAPESIPSRRIRRSVVAILLFTLGVVLLFCFRIGSDLGSTRLRQEADRQEYQLDQWIAQQTDILNVFTSAISAQPRLMEDYDEAVRWLNSVASRYPNISACYMANPYAPIPVIRNIGWMPGEDERPETRPWYRATERSPEGFHISSPYLDAQTGNYCVTFSQVVYGENSRFLGIFGIDFYLDTLIQVLGESGSSDSYAFLIDPEGRIVSHPHKEYEGAGVSVEDTEYAEAYHSQGITLLRDYSGHLYSCLCRKSDSGTTVLVALRWWSTYGGVLLAMLAFAVLFGVCILFIVSLINRLIRWQEGVNRQLVQAAQVADSANRAKSQFLSQMSHEIRTPMNAIIGLDSIALRDPDLPPYVREEFEKIGASAQHLLALINDILDMSRIEAGRLELNEKDFSLREFLEQINVIVGGQCADKGLRYECQVVGTPREYYISDDLKLKQILINILGNSVKFTHRPGSVFFSAEEAERHEGGCRMRFTITDTGIGMEREYLKKLYDAFSQEDGTTTDKYGGSGLGMAITKRLVDMMGGEILVESEKGVGTTFTVTIPLKDSQMEAEPVQEAAAEPVSLAGRHVLIAEDQAINAEILIDLLDMEEITSEWAENGQLAVELFAKSQENHFDAVLMDMRMPVMDGLTATREIRRLDRPDAKTVPIIALTANAFEEDVQQCIQAGMNQHLAKPVDMDLLLSTLGKLIR